MYVILYVNFICIKFYMYFTLYVCQAVAYPGICEGPGHWTRGRQQQGGRHISETWMCQLCSYTCGTNITDILSGQRGATHHHLGARRYRLEGRQYWTKGRHRPTISSRRAPLSPEERQYWTEGLRHQLEARRYRLEERQHWTEGRQSLRAPGTMSQRDRACTECPVCAYATVCRYRSRGF